MKKISFLVLAIFISGVCSFAQTEKPLLKIGDAEISKAEFERIYRKNNSNLYNESDRKSPEDYLDLFINFKLKVIEAEGLQMDTSRVFIDELAGYRKDLAAPYLTDVKYNEQMIKDLYYRMTKEVSASHILFRLDENASFEEKEKVFEKANMVREEILGGMDFNEAAVKYSEDPSAKTNQGKLGYFTAFQMVVPFENAAFNTPVGKISEPVKSSFGFHLIKVHDIRDNRGEVKVAHIMKMFPQGADNEAKEQLKKAIDSLYQKVESGEDFAEVAQKYSDDKRSAAQGGEMPWFSAGRMVAEFADPAFALRNNGDISKPVRTDFGWHIIKKIDSRKIKPFEEIRAEIEEKIKRDPARSISSKKVFIDKLKKEYNYSEEVAAIGKLKGKNVNDSTLQDNFVLFTIDDKPYQISRFKSYLAEKNITTGTMSDNLNPWIEEEITRLEDSKLEEKYDDFRFLMQEYHDGILLFNISEEKIWNYAVEDSAGLEKYYRKNLNKYQWDERFKGVIVICKTPEIREEAEKYFAADMMVEEILDIINKDKKDQIIINEGAWEQGSNQVVDYFVWNGVEPEHFNEPVTFVRGDKIPPEPKNLDDARGLYISDYQNYLEEQWIKELRKKYKIKVNKRLLKSIKGV